MSPKEATSMLALCPFTVVFCTKTLPAEGCVDRKTDTKRLHRCEHALVFTRTVIIEKAKEPAQPSWRCQRDQEQLSSLISPSTASQQALPQQATFQGGQGGLQG